MGKKRLSFPKYKLWFYVFLTFAIFFLLLNLAGGRTFVEAVVRSMISSVVVEVLVYLVYAVIFKEKNGKLKGSFFDKKDSDK